MDKALDNGVASFYVPHKGQPRSGISHEPGAIGLGICHDISQHLLIDVLVNGHTLHPDTELPGGDEPADEAEDATLNEAPQQRPERDIEQDLAGQGQ